MPRYFILSSQRLDDYTAITKFPPGMLYVHKPATGVRMGTDYQDGQAFDMEEDGSGLKVADIIHNTIGYLMVSSRLKAFLEQHAKADIEFLRFTLMNHKGRVERADCYIANVLDGKDWADLERSEGQLHPVHKGRFMRVKRLVLREAQIDPEANLFRLSAMPRRMIIREDLRALFEKEGMIGATFFEVGAPVNLTT